jgi:hypothetical protein
LFFLVGGCVLAGFSAAAGFSVVPNGDSADVPASGSPDSAFSLEPSAGVAGSSEGGAWVSETAWLAATDGSVGVTSAAESVTAGLDSELSFTDIIQRRFKGLKGIDRTAQSSNDTTYPVASFPMPNIDDFFANGLAALTENRRLPDELRMSIEAASLPGLLDEPRDGRLAEQIKSNSAELSPLFVSGLWLLAGDLDRSHSISQSDPSAEGSFWHGIMHRREGDYSNAKYWFRRVGSHPVLTSLATKHPDTFNEPSDFVDQVEKACRGRGADPAITSNLLMVQWTEWQLLMLDCLDLDPTDS